MPFGPLSDKGGRDPHFGEDDFEALDDFLERPLRREDRHPNIDGGKLRCTGATWTDAVIIFPGEVLAFQNIERKAHALRAPAPRGAVKALPPAEPDLGEDDFEGVE